jgi:hypothetical protein
MNQFQLSIEYIPFFPCRYTAWWRSSVGRGYQGQNRVHVLSIVMITASFLGAIILSILLAIT